MALLYRAIWEDSRPGLEVHGERAFVDWVRRKRFPIEELPREARGETAESTWTVTSRQASADGTNALRARLIEERAGETWTTTFTVLATPRQRTGWLWVDIDRTSADPYERHPFAAPRLVVDLITDAEAGIGRPRTGGVLLSAKASVLPACTLTALIRNQNRQLPLVVFGHDDAGGASVTLERAREAIARLAGIAAVYVLPPDELATFNTRMGDDLAIENGAVRVYLPTRGARGLAPGRHRFLPRARIDRHPGIAGSAIVSLLAPSATATPPPPAYRHVVRKLTLAGGGSTETQALLDAAFAENAELMAELDQLRVEHRALEESVLDLQIETEELQAEANRQAAHISALYTARSGRSSTERTHEAPDKVETIAEAITAAESLPGLVVHPDAPRDVSKLDRDVEGPKWANAIWQGLRALDEYGRFAAEAAAPGFWEWSRNGEVAWRWPATPKKLAMRESETVMGNKRLRRCRELPVDRAVEPSARLEMQAHLKISEGGGMLAPRVYFHDDTRGATGKVHVGYIGPHEHMPNTRTN